MLKTGYNSAKKRQGNKQLSGSGAPGKQGKPWEYFESMTFLDGFLEPCEDVLTVSPGNTVEEMGGENNNDEDYGFGGEEGEDNDTVTGSVFDPVTNTYSKSFTVEEEPSPFIRSSSASSFLTDYSSNPSQKRANSVSSFQNAKKKKTVDENDVEEISFLNKFSKSIDSIVAADKHPSQSDQLLKEVLCVMKSESAMFLKSLQSQLDYFQNDPRAFGIVKTRLLTVLCSSMEEFPQQK